MASTKKTLESSGLNIWPSEAADGPAPVFDIIAVQGLGSRVLYMGEEGATPECRRTKEIQDRTLFWKVKKTQGKDDSGHDGLAECMWIREWLVSMFKDAQVAT